MEDSIFTTVTGRRWLERQILPAWMPGQRWFAGKARGPRGFRIARQVAFGPAWLLGVEVSYAEGSPETYLVPLAIGDDRSHEIARMQDGRVLYDAIWQPEFRDALFRLMSASVSRAGLEGQSGNYLREAFPDGGVPLSEVLSAEQSNSSLVYGARLFVKLYRRLVAGRNPDEEIIRFLSEEAGFRRVPAYGGTVEWENYPVALATEVIPNDGDAWAWACQAAEAEFRGHEGGALAEGARKLGVRTGELHAALVGEEGTEFAPEPWTVTDSTELGQGIWKSASDLCRELAGREKALPEVCAPLVARLCESLPYWRQLATETSGLPFSGMKTRTHGDYHLGQVLHSRGDFVIIDFEGEPSRSLEERRAKRSPLRDVAGMLRSFHYAAHFAARKCVGAAAPGAAEVEERAATWQMRFMDGWSAAVRGSRVAPPDGAAMRLLQAFVVEKALYEVRYELNNRPEWVEIPLRGLMAALAKAPETAV